jgi:hypothetical protein
MKTFKNKQIPNGIEKKRFLWQSYETKFVRKKSYIDDALLQLRDETVVNLGYNDNGYNDNGYNEQIKAKYLIPKGEFIT